MIIRMLLFPMLAGLAMLFVSGCSRSSSDVSGTGGGTEIVCVSGSVVDSAGTAVAGAAVRMRRTDYLASVSLGKEAIFSTDGSADSSGAFLIPNVDTGTYLIEISASAGTLGAAVGCTVSTGDTGVFLNAIRLGRTSDIQGRVSRHFNLDPARVKVQIYGLERSSITDSAGGFVLQDIPAGTYALHFVAGTALYNPLDLPGIQVNQMGTTDLGSFNWPMKGPDINPVDSAALRAILDSNGLFTIPLQQVMSFDYTTRRITDLRLQHLRIRTLTSRIGDLTSLRTLNAEHDSLTSLPAQIGALKSLKELILRSNRLSALPAEIGGLDSLQVLDVSENQLENVTAAIGILPNLTVLSAGYNLLDSLPASLGDCALLTMIVVPYNRLVTLPGELSRLSWLGVLEVQGNDIDSVPQSLTVLGSEAPFKINIEFNRLCTAQTQEVYGWLDRQSVNPYWRQTQCR